MSVRDWSRCFICQTIRDNERTVHPSSSVKLRNSEEKLLACYQEVLGNMKELKDLGELPECVLDIFGDGDGDGGALGDGNNLVHLMQVNHVVWHKSCRNSIDNKKVERARKRKKDEELVSPVKTRRMFSGGEVTMQAPAEDPSSAPCIKSNQINFRW